MNPGVFDAVARCAVAVRGRRSLLGLIAGAAFAGAAFAAATPPLRTNAGKDPHDGGKGDKHHSGGGGGKDKKDKKDKKCRKQATACYVAVGIYCRQQYYWQPEWQQLCVFAHNECCGLYRDCKEAQANQCIREVGF